MTGRRRAIAWLVSLGVHVVLLLAVLWGVRREVEEIPPDPDRLVYVEPAPPPPPPPVASGGEIEQPVEAPVPEPERLVDAPTRVKPPTRKPTPKPTAMARAAVAPAVEKPAAAPQGGAGGVEGGVVGGTEGGKLGGVVGGRGDEVIAGNVAASPPMVTSRVLPEYPAEARSRRIEGQVLLQAIIDREGRVEDDVIVVRSQPPFDEAAVKAFRQWKFTPGRDRDGRTVRVRIEVPMRFQLR